MLSTRSFFIATTFLGFLIWLAVGYLWLSTQKKPPAVQNETQQRFEKAAQEALQSPNYQVLLSRVGLIIEYPKWMRLQESNHSHELTDTTGTVLVKFIPAPTDDKVSRLEYELLQEGTLTRLKAPPSDDKEVYLLKRNQHELLYVVGFPNRFPKGKADPKQTIAQMVNQIENATNE